MKKSLTKGFTLIELLVVIAIIAILISVGVVSYTRSLKLSRDARRKTDLEQIRQALETYRSELGTYPANSSSLTPDYITLVPEDPKAPSSTYIYTLNSSYTYNLCATLEAPVLNYCLQEP